MKLESTVDGPVLKKKVSTVTVTPQLSQPKPMTIFKIYDYDDEWVTAQQIQFYFWLL